MTKLYRPSPSLSVYYREPAKRTATKDRDYPDTKFPIGVSDRGAKQLLTIDEARQLRDQLSAAITKCENEPPTGDK